VVVIDCESLCAKPSLGKEDLARCMQISCPMQETLQDVRDQREKTTRSTVERLKALTLECKQINDRSAQTYEQLMKNP
jgi:hypothetical protein